MDYKYIEQLLERYWACETTLEEEQILRAFFLQVSGRLSISFLPCRTNRHSLISRPTSTAA